jgi:hypothetical protein
MLHHSAYSRLPEGTRHTIADPVAHAKAEAELDS